jgi:hypothetical protein
MEKAPFRLERWQNLLDLKLFLLGKWFPPVGLNQSDIGS